LREPLIVNQPQRLPDSYICVTCGTAQFGEQDHPPEACGICSQDDRQFVGLDGQQWTTLADLQKTHQNLIRNEEKNLFSIHTEPSFGIGQRAFLLQTRQGNLLWDCISLIDGPTVDAIHKLGGIKAIAISHPHYYSSMIEWSVAFDNAPIHLHSADRKWVLRLHKNIHFWFADVLALLDELVLIHTPGHFDGYQVLHWAAGADGSGVLLAGDQPQVCMDTNWVSFMYSYPNYIPLGAGALKEIVRRLDRYEFDRIYGAFPKRTVRSDAKAVIKRSAERYLKAITEN
jgi:hypothetical protein